MRNHASQDGRIQHYTQWELVYTFGVINNSHIIKPSTILLHKRQVSRILEDKVVPIVLVLELRHESMRKATLRPSADPIE